MGVNIPRFAVPSIDSDVSDWSGTQEAHTPPETPPPVILPMPDTPNDLNAHMDDANRLDMLERKFTEMMEKQADTNALLLQFVSQQAAAAPALAPGHQPAPHQFPPNPPQSVTVQVSRAKPANPPRFDGKREKAKPFLMACRTYFRFCSGDFPGDQDKIHWVLSFMTEGRALAWAQRYYDDEDNTNTPSPVYANWDAFEKEFREHFFPYNSEEQATNKLEGNSYFQGSRTVDEYLDTFLDLVSTSGYTDPKTIVVKFRRGLDQTIASTIATMPSDRPSDTKPDEWYKAASRIEQSIAADKAFRAAAPPP